MPNSPKPNRNQIRENLPDAELDVLTYLWQHGECTARQIVEGLADRRPMAPTTVLTLLERLRRKKFVKRRKSGQGKALVFQATRKPGPTHRRLVGDLLERIFGGDSIAMVSSLFATRAPSSEEIDQLEHLLEELKRRERESKNRD